MREKTSWYAREPGQSLFTAEQKELERVLPTIFGYHMVVVGDSGFATLADASIITNRVLINRGDAHCQNCKLIRGQYNEMPIASGSADLVFLPHTLEQVTQPHEVLTEAVRICRPEGRLVITGINPHSLWGARHYVEKALNRTPHTGKLVSQEKCVNWLSLLECQLAEKHYFHYRLPLEPLAPALQSLEVFNARCFSFVGAAYIIVAIKRELQPTMLKARWHRRRELWAAGELSA